MVLIAYSCHGVTLGDKAIHLPEGSPSRGWVHKHYLFMLLTVIPLFSRDTASEKCLHWLWNFQPRIPLSGIIMDLGCCTSLMGRWLCLRVYRWRRYTHTLVSSPGSLVQISLNDGTVLYHILHQLSSDKRTWTGDSSPGALTARKLRPEASEPGTESGRASNYGRIRLQPLNHVEKLVPWTVHINQPSTRWAFHSARTPGRDPRCK